MATIPPPTTAEHKFIGLLRELFQLDQADLDFGIYRILRQRQADVEQFLTKELPKHLTEARQQMATQGLDDVRKRRDNAQQRLGKDYKLDFSSPEALAERVAKLRGAELPDFEALYQEYEASQKLLDAAHLAEELERDAYNDLFRFFARYYDSGDFITQPRSGDAAYLMPYNGEEVKLYWANHDQYYIKTGENFRHYRFQQGRPDDPTDEARLTVELELLDAETTAGNNKDKKGRLYLPVADQPDGTSYFLYDADARHLRLRFRYGVPLDEEKSRWGDKQTKQSGEGGINERVLRDVEARIREGNEYPLQLLLRENNHQRGSGKNATAVNALTFHLHRFTVPNQFDYFIHRNLGRFLRQELDYYLKHELLALDFLSPDWRREDAERAVLQQLTRAGVVRAVAMRLIDFLHELEEYQRLLFEKKKLVARSSYCLTLDKIPSEARSAVLRYVLNEDIERKQLKAWRKLGMLPTDDYAPAVAWLEAAATEETAESESVFDKNHPYARLVLDTEYLTEELTDTLIHHIDNLDEQTGGVLINSENWQALNALQQRYSDQVRCITIDPPYNRLTDSFPYKDNFKHSSWLTMMYDRLKAARTLLRKDGALFSNIDENERQNLQEVLNMTFGSENRIEELIWSQNTTHSQSPLYSTNHEYV